jgi:hypothetical protein
MEIKNMTVLFPAYMISKPPGVIQGHAFTD